MSKVVKSRGQRGVEGGSWLEGGRSVERTSKDRHGRWVVAVAAVVNEVVVALMLVLAFRMTTMMPNEYVCLVVGTPSGHHSCPPVSDNPQNSSRDD